MIKRVKTHKKALRSEFHLFSNKFRTVVLEFAAKILHAVNFENLLQSSIN